MTLIIGLVNLATSVAALATAILKLIETKVQGGDREKQIKKEGREQ